MPHRSRTILLLAALVLAGCASRVADDQDLSTSWTFARGDATEGLHAPSARMPPSHTRVTLPHRVLAPNTPLWYSRVIELPAGALIDVQADDGAQVFVEDRKLEHERRTFFAPPSLNGRRTLTVRVLNNAMEGGLTSVVVRPGDGSWRTEGQEGLGQGLRFAPVESTAFRSRMPPADQPCDFTLWADSQGGWDTFSTLVSMMAREPHHFSAGVGDLVDDGSDPEAWRRLVEVLRPLASSTAIVPIAGNHDYDGYYNELVPRLYLQWFRAPPAIDPASWFAWSCGPARFVAIDVNSEFPIGISPESAQRAWLDRETASPAWTGARWQILLVHQPPWSRSWKGYDGDQAVRRIVERLAREHGLDLVVSGHSHAYERLTRYIDGRRLVGLIVGGAGGGLEDAKAGELDDPQGDRVTVAHHFVRGRATARDVVLQAMGLGGRPLDGASLAR